MEKFSVSKRFKVLREIMTKCETLSKQKKNVNDATEGAKLKPEKTFITFLSLILVKLNKKGCNGMNESGGSGKL